MEKFEKMFVSSEENKKEENKEENKEEENRQENKYQYTSKDGTVNRYNSLEELTDARREERENS